SLCGIGLRTQKARSSLCTKLRSSDHKTAFGAKPAENLTFPHKNARSQTQQPQPRPLGVAEIGQDGKNRQNNGQTIDSLRAIASPFPPRTCAILSACFSLV